MNIFKRPTTHYGKVPEPETPYQRAAQVWDERIGSARVQARNWRYMAFGSLILSAGFASALVWQSARGTVVPWVVQVDNLGQAQTVASAVADYRPTDPQIAFHLGRFIEQVRSLPADPIIVRQNWLRAYDWTTDRGAVALNDYARANVPMLPVVASPQETSRQIVLYSWLTVVVSLGLVPAASWIYLVVAIVSGVALGFA